MVNDAHGTGWLKMSGTRRMALRYLFGIALALDVKPKSLFK